MSVNSFVDRKVICKLIQQREKTSRHVEFGDENGGFRRVHGLVGILRNPGTPLTMGGGDVVFLWRRITADGVVDRCLVIIVPSNAECGSARGLQWVQVSFLPVMRSYP